MPVISININLSSDKHFDSINMLSSLFSNSIYGNRCNVENIYQIGISNITSNKEDNYNSISLYTSFMYSPNNSFKAEKLKYINVYAPNSLPVSNNVNLFSFF
jgi:hypothetical protein